MTDFPAHEFHLDGDPGEIKSSARRWLDFGAAAGDAAIEISSLDSSLFIGPEGDLYREGLSDKLPPHLAVAGQAYTKVGTALNCYADALAGLQDRMSPLRGRAPELWDALQHATRRLSTAQAADRRHQQQLYIDAVTSRADQPTAHDTYDSDLGPANAQLSTARQAWDDCLAAARAIKVELHSAVDITEHAIREAASIRFDHNPSGFGALVQDVADFIKDHVEELKKVVTALMLVATAVAAIALVVASIAFQKYGPFIGVMFFGPTGWIPYMCVASRSPALGTATLSWMRSHRISEVGMASKHYLKAMDKMNALDGERSEDGSRAKYTKDEVYDFGHAYFMGLNTLYGMPEEEAIKLGKAHEDDTIKLNERPGSVNSDNDKDNNQVGARIGLEVRSEFGPTPEGELELEKRVRDVLDRRILRDYMSNKHDEEPSA